MAVESDADRLAFVNPVEFGAAGTYALAGGGTFSLDGVFQEDIAAGVAANVSLGAPVPGFVCRTIDLPAGAKAGDTLTVAGRKFRVLNLFDPDATGMTTIRLG